MSILTIHLGVEYLTLSRLDFFQFTLVLGADRTTGHLTKSAFPMVLMTVRNLYKPCFYSERNFVGGESGVFAARPQAT